MENDTELWERLKIDASAYARLTEVFEVLCSRSVLADAFRPSGMGVFDESLKRIHGARIREMADSQAAGKKIVGNFSPFFPEEIVLACGGIPVGLPSGSSIDPGEWGGVPPGLCQPTASLLSFEKARLSPHMAAADLVVGDTSCSDRMLALQSLGDRVPAYLMDVSGARSERSAGRLAEEYGRFLAEMERLAGRAVAVGGLKSAIRLVNRRESALRNLDALRGRNPSPISGLDSLKVHQTACFEDAGRHAANVEALCDELGSAGEGRGPRGFHARPRLVVSGSPLPVPGWKAYHILEGRGAVVVGEDCYTGSARLAGPVDDSADTVLGLLGAMAAIRADIDYPGYAPASERLDRLIAKARTSGADGAVLIVLEGCLAQEFFAREAAARLKRENLPALVVRTHHGHADMEDLRVQTDTFVEMLR